MDCEMLEKCPFYNDKIPMQHGVGSILKKKYCQGNQQICARYLVLTKLGKEYVPANLYPNMLEMAQRIIHEAQEH